MLLVSYYTVGTGYEAEAKKLRESCERHGIPHRIEGVKNRGSWMANTQFKPTFLLSVLEQEKRPILWVDADGVVNQPLHFPFEEGETDFAAHWRSGRELLSGTLWFNHTEKAFELLREWKQECRRDSKSYDQVCLRNSVPRIEGLRVFRLPPEYTFIFDSMRRQHPDVTPIIEHFQASRRLKNKV